MKKNTKTFTEVFSGAFWVYANEDWSFCDNIIYNDMNSYITNLFACCKEPKFIEYLQKQYEPGNLLHYEKDISTDLKEVYDYNYAKFKKIFLKYRQELYHDTDGQEISITPTDFEMAFKYGFMLRHAFSGIPSKKIGYSYSASSYKPGMKKAPEPKSQILLRNIVKDKVQNKLAKVTAFESLDFEEHIKKYDSPETVFYIDPPYAFHEDNYFRGEENFGYAGHARLAKVLSKIKGKFLLSYYDFDDLKDLYPKDKYHWKSKSFNRPTASCLKDDTKDKKGHEVLILNYDSEKNDVVDKVDDFWK